LVGHFLFVEEAARKRLAPGEFFVDDIIGMSVCNFQKKMLGVVQTSSGTLLRMFT